MWEKKPNKNAIQKGKKCSWPGCDHNARSKGLCMNHYILEWIKKKENDRDTYIPQRII